MISKLIKLAESLEEIGLDKAAFNTDMIIAKAGIYGGDEFIEELIQELISDYARRGGSLGTMKEDLQAILKRHSDPQSFVPDWYEEIGETPIEIASNYLTDLVLELWMQRGKEELPTQVMEAPQVRELSPEDEVTEIAPENETTEAGRLQGDEAGEFLFPPRAVNLSN